MARKTREQITKENTDKYIDAMREITDKFMPNYPPLIQEYKVPEPLRFKIEATLEAKTLVEEIMKVLEGHTLKEIIDASNVVEKYVAAQSQGQLISYAPRFGV